jgi:glucose/arabinose dehydrogenase
VRRLLRLFFLVVLPASLFASCSHGGGSGPPSTIDADCICHDAPAGTYCALPGSVTYCCGGETTTAPGGKGAAPSLGWVTVPDDYCVHYFAHVTEARQLRFAPGGELFVAAPSTPTAGGAVGGPGAVVVFFDDDHDGYADGDSLPHNDGTSQNLTVFTYVTSVQGLMFTPGWFYFQNGTQIMKVPYAKGQRAIAGNAESVVDVSAANGMYVSDDHWPKTLDMADDGTIYLGNGGDQAQDCDPDVFPRPFTGGILKIDGTPGGSPVARGFRNAIAIRCERGKGLCFSTELALDGSECSGGREKLVPIRQGDDWGFPCCATANTPYELVSGSPNCADVAQETVSFVVGDTPFNFDFETGVWPAPYTHDIFVTLHGAVGSWIGARIVAIPTQSNGMPVPSSDLGTSSFVDFAKGWDDGAQDHGRPAAIAFSSDGRAFIADDVVGNIFWVAPKTLKTP